MGSHALSVVSGDKDQSLQAALNNLSASKAPLGIAAEPIVTAVHRMPAVEVLLNSPYIKSLIEKGEIHEIKDVMEQSKDQGMQTFDGALYDLYMSGKIELEEALRNADSRNNLMVKIRLAEGAKGGGEEDSLSVGGG